MGKQVQGPYLGACSHRENLSLQALQLFYVSVYMETITIINSERYWALTVFQTCLQGSLCRQPHQPHEVATMIMSSSNEKSLAKDHTARKR